jgi:glycosyltransferase involved in cell wall biosynthesis
MKITYIADSRIPSRSANSIHVMKMCQSFSKNGHDVTLIVPDRPNEEADVDGVFTFYDVEPCFEIEKVPCPNISSFGTFISYYLIARQAAKLDPDLVYGRSVIACYFASLRGFPTVFESHSPVTAGQFGQVKRFFFKRLIKRAHSDQLVVVSESLKEYYSEEYPHISEKILVARDASDPVDDSVKPVQFERSDSKLQVGYVGHLYSGRGMGIIGKMANRCPWSTFHIIGGNPEDVDKWRSKLSGLDNIKFYGFLPPNELDQYRLAFDVQIAPYQKNLETRGGVNTLRWMSPLKIFEYMAGGKAIIASDLPAIREILEHERTALLCEPANVDEWVTSLERLRDDSDFRKKLGDRAQEEFSKRYTWQARAKRIIDQLEIS